MKTTCLREEEEKTEICMKFRAERKKEENQSDAIINGKNELVS